MNTQFHKILHKSCQSSFKYFVPQMMHPYYHVGFGKTPDLYFSDTATNLSGEEFTRDVLEEFYAMEGCKLKFGLGKYGKPFLEDFPEIHFNISHTNSAVICAISDRPVGIDIEKKRKINWRIVNKFFTETERNYIISENDHHDERYTRIWTMKEAYVKFTGHGLHQSFLTFDVFNIQGLITFRYQEYYIAICQ